MGKKISELTLQELEEKKKKITGVYIGLGIVMIIACPLLFYFAFAQKNYALMAVAFGPFISLTPGLTTIAQVNKEIKTRKTEKE